VDTNTYDHPERSFDPTWSPDSKWIAYTKRLRSQLHAVMVHSLETGKSTQITDGLSDARYAQFDKNGKHLYFSASTDVALTTGWLDMSSTGRPVSRSVYVIVLAKDQPSPLAPESDEEKVAEEKPAEKPGEKPAEKKEGEAEQKPAAPPAAPSGRPAGPAASKEPPAVKIDFDGISQRILALPIPPRTYVSLVAGKTGILYVIEAPPVQFPGLGGATLHKFDFKDRKFEKVLDNISFFDVSANGEKMLYRSGPRWFIAATAQPPRPGQGAINVEALEMRVDPRAEWRQMYREVWRIQRDFVYDPGVHGLDIPATERKYAPYLESVAHRADLNYLFDDMLGEISLGHTYVSGGDNPNPRSVPGGLLGADYTIENGSLPFCPHLRWRKLESHAARAAHPARRERQGRRVPDRRQRPRPARYRQRLRRV
jgi:Uncharacterized protein related to the periplasmic component of the Tol biopolymer transport system